MDHFPFTRIFTSTDMPGRRLKGSPAESGRGASIEILTGILWVTLVKLPEALFGGISENCDAAAEAMSATAPLNSRPARVNRAELRFLEIRRDPDVPEIVEREDRLAGLDDIPRHDPFPGHDAGDGRLDLRISQLGRDDGELRLRGLYLAERDLVLGPRHLERLPRMVILLLGYHLVLVLIRRPVKILLRAVERDLRDRNGLADVFQRGLRLRLLSPQIGVVEPDKELSLRDGVPLVGVQRRDPAQDLRAHGGRVPVDIRVVGRDVSAQIRVPVERDDRRDQNQERERNEDSFLPVEAFLRRGGDAFFALFIDHSSLISFPSRIHAEGRVICRHLRLHARSSVHVGPARDNHIGDHRRYLLRTLRAGELARVRPPVKRIEAEVSAHDAGRHEREPDTGVRGLHLRPKIRRQRIEKMLGPVVSGASCRRR
ncbi:MAG: hypothetical protein NTW97_05410 [Candidatus Krumholzibacteria bacterium]|nr:hypothetical protein [Candidatus Krumholzibacteria bacterium]